MKDLDAILNASDVLGVLIREVPVKLLVISMAGCLFESSCRVDEGAVGTIHVTFDGQDYSDDVRIIRCSFIRGAAAPFRLGGQFLWATVPDKRSLRLVINQLQTRGDAQRRVRLTDWKQM